MYNRYLASAAPAQSAYTPPPAPPSPPSETPLESVHTENAEASAPRRNAAPSGLSVFGDLTHMLSGRLHNVKIDMDTILVLAIVWFLLADNDDLDGDLLLTIGALLLLGI